MKSITAIQLGQNLAHIKQEINALAQQAGRSPNEVKLIAVSKKQPLSAIEAALDAHHSVFGENTVQEALTKIQPLAQHAIEWHFIGHLQANKAKFIPGNFSWIHSLDSIALARKLSHFAQHQNAQVQALIEVNITADPKKHGILPAQLMPLLETLILANLPNIALRGLMTIGPQGAAEIALRQCFAQLRQIRDDCQQRFALPQFTELSMGMSGDFAPAIAEGATFVRIGSALFGERQ